MTELSLQDRYAPDFRCFGCGPKNDKGLGLKSFVKGEELIAEWQAEPHHEAFPGILNGGICATLLDCQCTWTAATHFMQRDGLEHPAVTVTAEFTVKLKAPTPSKRPLTIRAHVVSSSGNKVVVDASIEADGEITCTCSGIFVAIREGHPARDGW